MTGGAAAGHQADKLDLAYSTVQIQSPRKKFISERYLENLDSAKSKEDALRRMRQDQKQKDAQHCKVRYNPSRSFTARKRMKEVFTSVNPGVVRKESGSFRERGSSKETLATPQLRGSKDNLVTFTH